MTPKIIEFTLGNQEPSPDEASSSDNKKNSEVSEFTIGKNVRTKGIREKVMGQKKLKWFYLYKLILTFYEV